LIANGLNKHLCCGIACRRLFADANEVARSVVTKQQIAMWVKHDHSVCAAVEQSNQLIAQHSAIYSFSYIVGGTDEASDLVSRTKSWLCRDIEPKHFAIWFPQFEFDAKCRTGFARTLPCFFGERAIRWLCVHPWRNAWSETCTTECERAKRLVCRQQPTINVGCKYPYWEGGG